MSVGTESRAPDAIRLRPARWWHLAEMARLDAELFDPDVWSEETFWSELAAPGRNYLVAVTGSADGDERPGGMSPVPGGSPQVPGLAPEAPDRAEIVVGYAGLAVTGAEADVQTIAVAPRAQGSGLGRRLLTWLITTARDEGARHLLLEVRADNEPARRLYASAGFERIAVRRRYYQPGDIDAEIMRLHLTGWLDGAGSG